MKLSMQVSYVYATCYDHLRAGFVMPYLFMSCITSHSRQLGDYCRILLMLKRVGGKMAGVQTMLPCWRKLTCIGFLPFTRASFELTSRYLKRQSYVFHLTF